MLKNTSESLLDLGITSPTVVIDEARARRNIERMARKAARSGAAFRPHFKTHQCAAVGEWFADAGVDRITVSSLAMAEYFARAGWRDITLALLLNPLEAPGVKQLAASLAAGGGALGVLVSSTTAARAVGGCGPVRVWLKLDTGYGRSGVRWDDAAALRAVVEALPAGIAPRGLLTHAGHSYGQSGTGRIAAVYDETVVRLQAARDSLRSVPGCASLLLSLGDTPSCSVVESFDGVDEIRPGNFVFHDLMQLRIGSCQQAGLAAAVACPVVEIDSARHRLVLHGGAVHLSRESLSDPAHGTIHGCLGTVAGDGRGFDRVLTEAPLTSLSQEHGIVRMDGASFERVASDLRIGDLVLVWPVHSCLTCDLHRVFRTLEGRRLER